MDISKSTRQFYPEEQRILNTLKAKKDKEFNKKIKYHYFLILGLSAIFFTYLATIIKIDFLVFIFGTIAVIAYVIIVFMPYEIYKDRKKLKSFLTGLNIFVDKGTVDIFPVNAKRIAHAKEYEDEGDLFIIELDENRVLYLWDYDYNLRKKFPCLDFEIYEDKFYKLFGRQVYSLSEPIKPITIDKKAKWTYMKKIGGPEHLEIAKISFDKIVEEYNNCA